MSAVEEGGRAVSRRTLVVGGSAVVVAASVVGRFVLAGRGDGSLASLATAPGPKISVGYVDRFPDAGRALSWGERDRIVPATSVRAGELGAATTVRLAGPTPGLVDDAPFAAVDLDALYPNARGDQPLRYFAWSYRADPRSVSSPVRFTAPVEAMSLGFALRAVPFTGEARIADSVLTGGTERGLPRLRPGTYLLGLGEGIWDEPSRLPAAEDRAWSELASVALTLTPAG